ncbi:MAG TPA: hemin uptake protein HemP [Tepidisphaeraceae bacterium]|nr:hemin uptake protein HemP [Tepidisphaeraceae bacterium]
MERTADPSRPPAPALQGLRGAATKPPVVLDTAALFAGGTEVRLQHRGQEYRLRVTRQGKLILTK